MEIILKVKKKQASIFVSFKVTNNILLESSYLTSFFLIIHFKNFIHNFHIFSVGFSFRALTGIFSFFVFSVLATSLFHFDKFRNQESPYKPINDQCNSAGSKSRQAGR